MPKRKLVKEASEAESELLQPPADLPESQASPFKKRKTKSVKKEKVVGTEEAHAERKKNGRRREQQTSPISEQEVLQNVDELHDGVQDKKKASRKRRITSEVDVDGAAVESDDKATNKKVKRKRKTKEEKEAEAMPLAARTVGHKLFIGAHISASGGVQNSIANSVHIGANAFALFLKSQRKWANPPLVEDQCSTFHDHCKSHAYDQGKHVVPHGSYLVNLAHTDKARTEQAYAAFLDDLQRCERLGIQLYNFHPGVANSTNGDRQAAIGHLASNINRAHKETTSVVTLLENMAHGGNTLGSTFEDLRDIIALIHDQKRVGVCLDTCHAFAGGYDLRTSTAFESTMSHFDDIVGVKYLRAVHMNDSKAPFNSHRDLHANLGTGFLGLRAFHSLVNDTRFEGLPLILETPLDDKDEDGSQLKDDKGKDKEDKGIWAREIKMLESMVGMDTENEEFLQLEKKLAGKGESERKKMLEQTERKKEKDEKKAKSKRSRKTKKAIEDEDDESPLTDLEDEGIE